MMAKRTGRKKSQLPDCYYEGYLEKKSLKDQTSQKLWTCLCGSTLFFFHEKRDIDYVDKVDLTALVSVEDDDGSDSTVDSARFTIQLQSGSIKFTAPSSECRELWKGFIHAVGQLSVPSSLNLLPGQIHMMGDAVQKEKERRANIHYSPAVHSPPASTQSDMPACFFEVPRLEAELLLEREASKGNLLVRPRRSQNSYAISTRMEISGAVFKHYRVLCKESGGFYIDVENPVFGDTLQDVVDYLVEKTNGSLTPLIIEEQYDKKLSFIVADDESGEKTQQPLPNFIPRAAPRKHVEERSTSEVKPAGAEYFSFTDHATPAPKKVLMPPSPAPRKGSVASSTNVHGDSRKSSSAEEHKKILSPAISELKLRLGQKLKIYDV
ncbi:signal-transducing adaptor protein 1 [Nematolebias whitei]|uniref:signal-transducing adaptor protein 1 n=1 Tax=Nematolebias whitei TaxID=451745 RepID=UPI00189A68AB|nr:signal-transducing adaptor protein 1 [Nematolebias whitei]